MKFNLLSVRNMFALLAIAFLLQSAHFAEHVAQIVQIYAQQIPPPNAHGLLGSAFDFEWVHFLYNISLEIALITLWLGYDSLHRSKALPLINKLMPSFISLVTFQGYHVIEHSVKLFQYLLIEVYQSGSVPTPGILPTVTGWPIFLVHFWINLIVWVLMVVLIWRLHMTFWVPAYAAQARKSQAA
jgi:hypothetical protein